MNIAAIVGRRRRNKPAPASLLRHQRKCRICNHEHREAIESRFLFWESAHSIVKEFSLGHRSLLYRHATATGLLAQRRENFTSALDSMVEQCETVPVTAASILRAIRAYSCLNAHGRWVEPPKRRTVGRVNKSSRAPRISNRDTAIRKRRKPMKTNATRKF
ncbi:MAG: hypothetical protein WCC03_21920 [Candidatus Acidiferrales bacterium]